MPTVTIKEIARLAGVSRGTVDRVLKNRSGVNVDTRRKVLDIAEELHYKPNLAGKTLAIRKKQLKFGFLLLDPAEYPYCEEIQKGIENKTESLSVYGVEILVRIYSPDTIGDDVDALQKEGIAGLAVTPLDLPSVRDALAELAGADFPLVLVHDDLEGIPRMSFAGSDAVNEGRLAAGLCRLICPEGASVTAAGNIGSVQDRLRLEGFTNYCKKQSVPYEVRLSDHPLTPDEAADLMLSVPQSAIFYPIGTDPSVFCAAKLRLNGRKIHLIGNDLTRLSRPLLESGALDAVIEQHLFAQGTQSLQLLLEYIGLGRTLPDMYYTKNEIILRENIPSR